MSLLSNWWIKWFGTGTPDDWRNFGWRITEALAVKAEWARYLIDLRIGFKKSAKWNGCYMGIWTPVTENFWNGIFTLNVYVLKTTLWKTVPMLIPRVGVVIRFAHDWYFQFGVGILFDRGEFGFKLRIAQVEPGDAVGWEEGSV